MYSTRTGGGEEDILFKKTFNVGFSCKSWKEHGEAKKALCMERALGRNVLDKSTTTNVSWNLFSKYFNS